MKNTIKLTRVQRNIKLYRQKLGHRLVRIYSLQWGAYWAPNRSGYVCEMGAGIYTFLDALDASTHCGPEKGIVYEFLSDGKVTQEPKGPAVLLLRSVM